MSIKTNIPNIITLLNLLCGSIAVVFAVHNNFMASAVFVFLGIFFDFFDGLVARKLNVQSDLGIQLDSLADMVTSGLVPGIVMFKLISLSISAPEMVTQDNWSSTISLSDLNIAPMALIGLFITLASAYRLAKFNIDDDQQTYFKGLPTPANTLMVMSLPLIIEFQNNSLATALILNQWFLIAFTLLSCYLLNSNIKLLALKFKDFNVTTNKYRYMLIIMSIILLLVMHVVAVPLIIVLYILLSLLQNATDKTI